MLNVKKIGKILNTNEINFFRFNRCRMIKFDNSELHNEATRTMTDAAASAQTAYGCHEGLRVREDSRIVNSRVGGAGIPIGLRQKGENHKRKLALKFKNFVNLCTSYKIKFVKCYLVTDDPGSKPDQKYARWRDR